MDLYAIDLLMTRGSSYTLGNHEYPVSSPDELPSVQMEDSFPSTVFEWMIELHHLKYVHESCGIPPCIRL